MGRFISVLLVAALPTPALASRVISISVELDGKEVLEGGWGDNGFAGRQIVWRYLKGAPLHPVNGFAVPTDPADPSVGVLKGKVVVKVQYGADASATILRLKAAPRGGWLVDPEWVEANAPPGSLADEEARAAASGRAHRSERESYRWGSYASVGFAAVSWVGCLAAFAASIRGGRRSQLRWVCLAAVVFGALAILLRFVGTPYFPDDDNAYDLRTYAMYSGVVSCGLAVVAWVIARRSRPDAAPAPGTSFGDEGA